MRPETLWQTALQDDNQREAPKTKQKKKGRRRRARCIALGDASYWCQPVTTQNPAAAAAAAAAAEVPARVQSLSPNV